ncbi:zinc finger protein basonuclin-1 isoform X2 [Paramormyrops kingsleyae]|uniref:Basonuclin zinc finger protein 1 n=1 Tax=Paramormyrops kingsleyae TaxID=1676925 RepID=A0A3B3Q3T5_9TELE|nr:zinc finger protein basonuclin-1-like isoform X2 [Paramormyrops kingsleyae]
MASAIRCTLVNCNCESFKPGKLKRRQCEHCRHGWVAHALSKLKVSHTYQSSQVEIVHSNVVFDISSLMLYGTQAVPVRLKILLDRLFSVLKQDEVVQILNALDWTLQDYIRGYVLQDVTGKVLDRWVIMTFEEEIATLQQFLRFGETKSIVELMAIQDKEGQVVAVPSSRTNSDIRAFIENTTQHGPSLPAKVEKPGSGSVHHFENFINNMAFMLPFQFLSPVPAPLLGASPSSFLVEQDQRREQRCHPEEPIPTIESGLLGSGSTPFSSDTERTDHGSDTAPTKVEPEDFSTGDNYSDAPSTPCTPSMTSDITQMSPESKMRSLEKSAGGLKKGRVFCSACEKTFYDKGTLKIHYNAVHLKIKHKCTIEGCNMVFSSLRSRNRHSANPNPRLHMPMNRNNRDKDLRNSLSADEASEGERRTEYGVGAESRQVSSYLVNNTEPKLQGTFPSISQSGILFPNLKTVQPVLPFYRSLVTPAELANTPSTLPSLPLISSSVPLKPVATEASLDPVPKKKSRKSSMPIKIEKETTAAEDPAEESGSDDEIGSRSLDKVDHDGGTYGQKKAVRGSTEAGTVGVIQPTDREPHLAPSQRPLDFRSNTDLDDGLGRMEGSIITCTSPCDTKHKENQNLMGVPLMPGAEDNNDGTLEPTDFTEGNHGAVNGDLFNNKEAPDVYMEEYGDVFLRLDREDVPHHCEICRKTFKNPYSVKMHYRNVHLKEMHMCTVDGCNAAFPSRRSRDRHSANMNLHHKLLTKDHYGTPSTVCSSSSPFRDVAGVFHQDFPLKDPIGQTSVIFKGSNRMGLVYPMSKSTDCGMDPAAESSGEGEAVLDLSTTSASRSGGSVRSWDSDRSSEEGLPVEDSDEGCEEMIQESKVDNHSSLAERPSDSPITCHLCQKVYSNKGTFRAHYKTVHLRLLHKCKVPGCDTSFSSVRSRNRHSQNPNLHRNLTPTMVHGKE